MKKTFFICVVLAIFLESLPAQDTVHPDAVASRVNPHAKSRQESDDYHAAWKGQSAATLDQASRAFAQRYPDSELRISLFSKAMRQYQVENDADGMLAMGERVLSLDPDNPLALVLTATALADGLTAGDPDREAKVATINRDAEHAIRAADSNFVASATATAQQVAVYKTTLQSMAYAALGMMKLKTGDDAGAEKDLRSALSLTRIRPDPYLWYHLALAQDHRKRYPAALHSVEQALQLASANPQLQRLAEAEHDRLNRLAGSVNENSDPDGEQPPP